MINLTISNLPVASSVTEDDKVMLRKVDSMRDKSATVGQLLSAGKSTEELAARNTSNTFINRNNTALLIPMYIYPGPDVYNNAVYNGVISALRTTQGKEVYIILNPGSGPGTVVDGQYTTAIKRLQGAGAKILAYVASTYGAKLVSAISTEITTWKTFYPLIDGLFIDEFPYETTDERPGWLEYGSFSAYGAAIRDFAWKKGLAPIIGNSGSISVAHQPVLQSKSLDAIVIHENSSYPTEVDLKGDFAGGYSESRPSQKGVLVYNQASYNSSNFNIMKKYAHLVYVNSTYSANAWDVVSTFLADQLTAI